MRKLFLVALVISGFLLVAHFPYHTDRNIRNKILERTVKIEVFDADFMGWATGTMLGHNYIITNAHLFPRKPTKNLQIQFRRASDSDYTNAVVISSASKTDLALLHFEGHDYTQNLRITDNWKLGESIILLGNPGSGDFKFGNSRIVMYAHVYTPLKKLRTMLIYPCNEAAPGFSGSGIYNSNGEYLGTHELGQEIPIISTILSKLAGEQVQGPLCFAIPAREILERNLNKPWFGYELNDK